MIMPIGDDNRDRHRTPWVTWTLIAINVAVFVLLQGVGTNLKFTYAFATVPQEILTGHDLVTAGEQVQDPVTGRVVVLPGLGHTPISVYLTLLTAIFMHGSFAHLFGNMLFLWIFGDNVEDRVGRGRFVGLYLAWGLLASLAHVATTVALDQDRAIPSLGASGAISGVLGAYLVLFPHRRVTVMLLRMVTQVPAIAAIGMWFAFQVISGLGMLGGTGGGVAYGAHIGGFVAGLVLIKPFDPGPRRPAGLTLDRRNNRS